MILLNNHFKYDGSTTANAERLLTFHYVCRSAVDAAQTLACCLVFLKLEASCALVQGASLTTFGRVLRVVLSADCHRTQPLLTKRLGQPEALSELLV